uniref:Uncharacterized protein n=2 Tax=Pipistrellus kuhlii TaxID=59472 RepID=A0A7J7TW44_PIPKU|nr:hypothetical protein mPipKuh1_009273 [Pipistrellus kuhlii]
MEPEKPCACGKSGRGWRTLTHFSGGMSLLPSTYEISKSGTNIKGALAPAQLSIPLEAHPAIPPVGLLHVQLRMSQQNQCCPPPQQCYPAPMQCCPLPQQCYLAPQQCYPAPMQCYPAPMQCCPPPQQCYPAPMQCCPLPQQCYPAPMQCYTTPQKN